LITASLFLQKAFHEQWSPIVEGAFATEHDYKDSSCDQMPKSAPIVVPFVAKTLPSVSCGTAVRTPRQARSEKVKVGNAASEIGGGVGPNNATSPMNQPLFGGSQVIYTFSGCCSLDLSWEYNPLEIHAVS
jgi:hypothetical protein